MTAKGFKMLGVECPECGDLQTGVAKAGLDSEGHRIRARHCRNCETTFTTVEVPIPFVFNRMDVTKPERSVEQLRKSSTYTAVPRREPDRFTVTPIDGDNRHAYENGGVTIRFHPGRQSDWCRKGLHRLVGKNLELRDGVRHCAECRREWQRAYRREFAIRFPELDAERRHQNKMRSRARRAAAKAARQAQNEAAA